MGPNLELTRLFEYDKKNFAGTLEFNSALSRYTYYQIGGPAAVIATPRSWTDLSWLANRISESGCPVFILGWGSNLLFKDQGFDGLVIRLKHFGAQILESEPGVIEVGASVGGPSLLRTSIAQGWGGLELLTGIPGSLGGMVAMNAGTHLGEISSRLARVETWNWMRPQLAPTVRELGAQHFSYRKNHFLSDGEIVTRAWLRVEPSDPQHIKKSIDLLYQRRKETQPVDYPSCGSVFMNPLSSGFRAWEVVDRLGLRGHRVGQAEISKKHPNFIINLGGARASEVLELIELVQRRARDELGIPMETEVKVIS